LLDNHFSATYENVVEKYRVHAILLSFIGVNGDWFALLTATVVGVAISANILKTLHPIKTAALLISSHAMTTIVGLILNFVQLRKVQEARYAVSEGRSPIDDRGINIVDLERTKQFEMFKNDTALSFLMSVKEKTESINAMEKELKEVGDDEILNRAELFYRKRKPIQSGAYLGIADFFMLLHVNGRMPFSLFVPYFVFIPTISMVEFQRSDWAKPESAIQALTAFGAAATMFMLTKKSLRIYKWQPATAKKTKTRFDDVMGKDVTRLDPKALEAMRKRNDRFREKKSGQL
jgi:hypothetical protein